MLRELLDPDVYLLYREWRLGRFLKKARGRRGYERLPGLDGRLKVRSELDNRALFDRLSNGSEVVGKIEFDAVRARVSVHTGIRRTPPPVHFVGDDLSLEEQSRVLDAIGAKTVFPFMIMLPSGLVKVTRDPEYAALRIWRKPMKSGGLLDAAIAEALTEN